MSALRLVLLTVLALAFDAAAGFFAPPSFRLDPLLVVAVVAALQGNRGLAIGAGLLTGIVEDAWVRDLFGQRAFTHMVTAYLVALAGTRLDLTQTLPAAATLAAASLLDWGLQLGIAALFDRPVAELPGPAVWAAAALGNMLIGLLLLATGPRRRRR